ncbi:hypothetical protein LTR51_008662 [Lithohypha guttulata]|nr:hypothetical protein LTR51_008662 [Lithohypha guttulata]
MGYSQDHSIEAGGECVMVYINNTSEKQANARFVNCETDRGRVIRAFSTRIIRRGEEITACYHLRSDVQAANVATKAITYRGLILQPRTVVFVYHGGGGMDWIAMIEDLSVIRIHGKNQYRVHVQWMKNTKRSCPRRLRLSNTNDIIDLQTINGIVQIRSHTTSCEQLDTWCWAGAPCLTTSSMEEHRKVIESNARTSNPAIQDGLSRKICRTAKKYRVRVKTKRQRLLREVDRKVSRQMIQSPSQQMTDRLTEIINDMQVENVSNSLVSADNKVQMV